MKNIKLVKATDNGRRYYSDDTPEEVIVEALQKLQSGVQVNITMLDEILHNNIVGDETGSRFSLTEDQLFITGLKKINIIKLRYNKRDEELIPTLPAKAKELYESYPYLDLTSLGLRVYAHTQETLDAFITSSFIEITKNDLTRSEFTDLLRENLAMVNNKDMKGYIEYRVDKMYLPRSKDFLKTYEGGKFRYLKTSYHSSVLDYIHDNCLAIKPCMTPEEVADYEKEKGIRIKDVFNITYLTYSFVLEAHTPEELNNKMKKVISEINNLLGITEVAEKYNILFRAMTRVAIYTSEVSSFMRMQIRLDMNRDYFVIKHFSRVQDIKPFHNELPTKEEILLFFNSSKDWKTKVKYIDDLNSLKDEKARHAILISLYGDFFLIDFDEGVTYRDFYYLKFLPKLQELFDKSDLQVPKELQSFYAGNFYYIKEFPDFVEKTKGMHLNMSAPYLTPEEYQKYELAEKMLRL